jgi:putative cardiolipin synthase
MSLWLLLQTNWWQTNPLNSGVTAISKVLYHGFSLNLNMGHRMHRLFGQILLILLSLGLGACATVDFDYPRDESFALQSHEGTYLDGITDPYIDAHPGQSGFFIQADGIDALAGRLVITKKAQKTIDAQYYLISSDSIGRVFIKSLLDAADRGVRVRLLLDDIQTKGYDAGMAALDSHPNFEVRIFNPFAGRGSRIGDAFTSFSRINRRMHNKSFTVDNEITIIGGRNIADEYFGASGDVNFGDLDVMAVGPVVQDVSNMFDLYWNHRKAAPVPAFANMPDDPAAELIEMRKRLENSVEAIKTTRYADAVREDYENYLESSMEMYTWADYKLAYDSPDKVYKKEQQSGEIKTITATLATAVESAQKNLIIVSPYFVPRKKGIAYLSELREQGIEITVITNSLAATNHDIVHSGYAPARKPLLKAGVKILEIKHIPGTDELDRGGLGDSLATLHTKSFVVDCKDLFIGSFNWDPRSVEINTELGVIIRSPKLAGEACEQMQHKQDGKAYEVVLNEKGKLRWIDRSGPEPVTLTHEPDTGFWRRFKVGFMRILPVDGQL